MNTVKINGKTYSSSGNISVVNGVVYIDDSKVADTPKNVLRIEVTGTLNNLKTDLSVNCEDVQGSVEAGGSVNCDRVGGNVNAGGSVNCDNVGGNVSAGGSIIHG